MGTLLKYRKVFKLGDTTSTAKEELLPAVQRHWAATVLDEDETTVAFAVSLRAPNKASR